MRAPTYSLSAYLKPDEAFHLARVTLRTGQPRHLHKQDFHECFLVEAGVVAHWSPGGASILRAGAMVFVRPGDAHGLESRSGAGDAARIVNLAFPSAVAAHLNARYGNELEQRWFWSRAVHPETIRLEVGLHHAVLEQLIFLESGTHSRMRLEAFLLWLFASLSDAGASEDSDLPGWLARALRAVREPAVFRQGVQGLVSAAGRGHEHVARSMRKHLGVTPSDYVNQLRMEHAGRMVLRGEHSVEAVMEMCGLSNRSHFYSLFKARFGMTPRAYRAREAVGFVQPGHD